MIRICASLLLFWISAWPATAQEIPVRSGEHGDFTRLVLDVPAGTAWELDQTEAGKVQIRFGRAGYRFDLSRAFDRIDRARVAGLSALPDGQGMTIDLGCACDAEAFLLRDRMLVVDLRPADPSAPSALSGLRIGANPGIGPARAENVLLPKFSLQTPPDAQLRNDDKVAPSLEPGVFERMLAEQLATAATEGLLDPALQEISRPPPADEQSGAEAGPAPDRSIVPTAQDSIAAAITEADLHDPQARIRIGGSSCLSDDLFDVASWGGTEPLTETVPDLRARLYGEFDKLDPEALTALVRAYISVGFGAEARALLDLSPDPPDPVLMALAGIVDGHPDRAGVFAGQTGCDGAAALWALAGSVELPKDAPVNDKAIRRSFEALPLPLRALLGPRLSTRLAEEGAAEAARNLLSRLARATGGHSEDMAYSGAQIDRLEGAVDQAQAVLKEVAHGPGPYAPDAVAEVIEIATEQGRPVDETMTALSGTYATELRQTEKGPELWLAHLRALAANGEFDAAARAFREKRDYPDRIRTKAASEMLALMAEQAPDTEFLKQAVAQADRFDRFVMPEAALAVAGRLLDLGFSGAAARWVALEGVDPAARATRLMAARIHLAGSEPEAAEIALIGLQGDDVLRLRAEARRMMGDFDYARTAYATLGDSGESRAAAWLAGDWPALDGQADSLAATAELVQSDLPDPTGGAPSLALAESLVGSGEKTRDTLRALLEDTRMSGD
ncbi:hypothetical protein M4578_16935 [Salipiger sp. P9]|uniref:hypothetical protein n=1 Tax=Salipiger pentaromativorans TaxID=2943193 RepID=UPI0021589243|nr:hypothetical protein [Salipiger pentaromativorans]MCR8549518.1 hypothetical protein [Salipiger pentaromativorans]